MLQVSMPETSLKRDSGSSIFPVNFLQFFKKLYLQNTSEWLFLLIPPFQPKFLSIDHTLFVFSSLFSFIIDNWNYGSLLRKCLKMKIFLLFTIVYLKINTNVVKAILPWQWFAYTQEKIQIYFGKTLAFVGCRSKFRRLILKLGIKNWVLKAISCYYIAWQIHQLFLYIYLINFSFLKCFQTLSWTSRKDLFWNLRE